MTEHRPQLPPPPLPPHLAAAGDARSLVRKLAIQGGLIAVIVGGLLWYGLTREEPVYDEGARQSVTGVEAGAAGDSGEPASLWIDGGAAADATVLVDGGEVGSLPLWIADVTPGTRWVQVIDTYGEPLIDTTIVAMAGETTNILFNQADVQVASAGDLLDGPFASASPAVPAPPPPPPAPPREPARDMGDLRVTSSPSGASVTLNGRRVGTTPLSLGGLRSGRHAVAVGRRGYEGATRQVDVLPGRIVDLAVSLRPVEAPQPERVVEAGTGTLEVLVQPWGRIVIDGTVHQRETDVVYRTPLPAGSHTVTVSHPQLGSRERTVVVQPGVPTRVEFDLRPGAGNR